MLEWPGHLHIPFFILELEHLLADLHVLLDCNSLEGSAATLRTLVDSLELGILRLEFHVDFVPDVLDAGHLASTWSVFLSLTNGVLLARHAGRFVQGIMVMGCSGVVVAEVPVESVRLLTRLAERRFRCC